jgi:DNA-binding LytR/AlgR family response regulator
MQTAIIADDEPRLAQDLAARLRILWPQLEILAVGHDGVAAASLISARQPTFAFLDIRMPGIDGIGVAKIARETRIVFVTAHDEYAVAAFDAAAADYLLKPVSDARLAQCVARLRQQNTRTLDVDVLASLLMRQAGRRTLEWLTIRLADTTRLVSVEEVLYFQSGDKYTEVVTATERHLIRSALKELLEQLDPNHFAQIHRSVIVNLRAVAFIERDILGRSRVHLRGRVDTLPLSRSFVERFKQM